MLRVYGESRRSEVRVSAMIESGVVLEEGIDWEDLDRVRNGYWVCWEKEFND